MGAIFSVAWAPSDRGNGEDDRAWQRAIGFVSCSQGFSSRDLLGLANGHCDRLFHPYCYATCPDKS